jgi:hypothetical protein
MQKISLTPVFYVIKSRKLHLRKENIQRVIFEQRLSNFLNPNHY